MKASEKYKRVFGQIDNLATEISWSTGVSNMLEWLTWNTNNVLGISKTRYWKLIVQLSHDPKVRDGTLKEKEAFVKSHLEGLVKGSERLKRYDKSSSTVASPREALRRAKYFSEDYLNKEFDIFWGLVSDAYLDSYYGQLFDFEHGGSWFNHGNSDLFAYSTDISAMQMDNLSFNASCNLLIANELKLGGAKNPDQILKYSLMYRMLVERGFIPPDTSFALLFIGDRVESPDWMELIDKEIQYCESSLKSTLRLASDPKCIGIARSAKFASTSWNQLYDFNTEYMKRLSVGSQQVERKLLWGFNEALSTKAFFQR